MILGGGPIGLLTGNLFLDKGIETIIYEEDTKIGRPQHCTGLVSFSTLDLYPVTKKEIITNKLYGVKIRIGNLLEEEFYSTTAKAVVVNRELLEVKLAERYQDKGGKIILGRKITEKSLREKGGIVINAGGTKELLKSGYSGTLPALQFDIYTRNMFNKQVTIVDVDKTLNPVYFSWATPVDTNGTIRIGTAADSNLEDKLRKLIKKVFLEEEVKIIKKLGGRIIANGPRKEFINDSVLYVGDSAGMTKISTGGGLNYGGIGAHILVEIINEGRYDEYRDLWVSRFKREIQLQRLIREVFLKLDNKKLVEIYNLLSKREVLKQLFLMGDMDYHATGLYKILLEKDFIKTLLKEGVASKFIKYLFTKV